MAAKWKWGASNRDLLYVTQVISVLWSKAGINLVNVPLVISVFFQLAQVSHTHKLTFGQYAYMHLYRWPQVHKNTHK